MPRGRRSQIDPILDLTAAYLSMVEELPHKEIQDRIHANNVQAVTRALDRAEDRGWIRRKQVFVREQIPPELFLEMIEKLGMQPELSAHFRNSSLGEIQVVSGATLERFGREAAVFVARRLSKCASVGVAWGGEVSSVVAGLGHVGIPRSPDKAIEVFPVRGDIGFLPSRLLRLLDAI